MAALNSQLVLLVEYARWFELFKDSFNSSRLLPSCLTVPGRNVWKDALNAPPRISLRTLKLLARERPVSVYIRPEDVNRAVLIKEIDDVISRCTSYDRWYEQPRLVEIMLQEMAALTVDNSWVAPPHPTPLPGPLKMDIGSAPGYEVTIFRPSSTSPSGREVFYTIRYPTVSAAIRKVYPSIARHALAALTILYYVQRSDGGSNWSPSNSYPGLAQDYDSGKVGILEVFCGLLNNRDLIEGRQVTHGRFALDWQALAALTGDKQFIGTWPDSIDEHLDRLFERFGEVRLLVNPPYSETEIQRTMTKLSELFVRYPRSSGFKLRASMTLPMWDDLFEDGGVMDIEGAQLVCKQAHTSDMVYNYSSSKKPISVPLHYYTFDMEQE